MADEVSTLIFKAKTSDLDKANQSLKKLEKQSGKTAKASDGLAKGAKRLAVAFLGVSTAMAGITKFVSSARTMDVLNAQLVTVTGSADKAARAFAAIEKFTQATPFQVEEVTNAFIKLRNFGLNPSEKSLMSYGNTASALGRTLDDIVMATAGAVQGENERLKMLAITTRVMGDEITFTFQGVSETMKKTSENIEQYMLRIGNVNFVGAAEERAKSLDGSLSNLEDAWDSLWRSASRGDVGSELSGQIREISELLKDEDTKEGLKSFFSAGISGITHMAESYNMLYTEGKRYYTWLASIAAGGRAFDDIEGQKNDIMALDKKRAAEVLLQLGELTKAEEQASIKRFKALTEESNYLKIKYGLIKEAVKAGVTAPVDDSILSDSKVDGGETEPSMLTGGQSKRLQELMDVGKSEVELERQRYESLLAEQAAYEEGLNMSAEQGMQVRAALAVEHQANLREITLGESEKADAAQQEIDDLKQKYMTEEELEVSNYQAKIDRLREFLELSKITKDEFNQMSAIADEEHKVKSEEIDNEKWNKQNQWMQDGLSMADKYYAGMQGKDAANARVAIKAMQLLGDAKKRSALKNAIVKGWEGIQEAAAVAPPPANFIPIAIATAQMGASVGGIMGARELGGQVMPEQPYLVGERGPELFVPGNQGNIMNSDKLNRASGGQSGQNQVAVNVNIQAMDGASVEQVLDDNRGHIFSMINEAVNDQGRGALV